MSRSQTPSGSSGGRPRDGPEWALEAGQTSYEALRAGELDVVSDDYEKVTGRKAATIAQIITEIADEMPLATSAADF